MKKFIVKSLLIFSPFLVAIAIEVFVFPVDFLPSILGGAQNKMFVR